MSQAEMDAALDAIEAEHNVVEEVIDNEPLEVIEQPDEIDQELDALEAEGEPVEEAEESPPGFMGYEEWVAKGKDPKKFRGEDAYTAEFDRIQELKGVKSEISGLKETMSQVAQVNEEWRKTQVDNIRSEYESKFNDAKEAGDIDGALDAQSKLNELDNKPVGQPQQPQINPLISKFREQNPLTDHNNSRFNPEYNADLESIYNGYVDKLSRNGQVAMSDNQITRCLALAKKEAGALNPDLFESPRNRRQTTPTKGSKKSTAPRTTDYRSRLQGIGNARNKGDSNAAIEMYDMLLKKGGKDAADKFAKSNLGE